MQFFKTCRNVSKRAIANLLKYRDRVETCRRVSGGGETYYHMQGMFKWESLVDFTLIHCRLNLPANSFCHAVA